MEVEIFNTARAITHVDRLAEILRTSVENGALVGFILPFDIEQSRSYWQSVFDAVSNGERILICAVVGNLLVGTVQLYLSPEPNAPHRAEVFKLLVHPDFQRQGVAAALMLAVEREARQRERSLLLLDTVAGGAGERLYRRLGWQEVGFVPRHFVDPHGLLKTSVYFMRNLD